MSSRKNPIIKGEIYHIFSKSIAEFKIFRKRNEYQRMKEIFAYYKAERGSMKFSAFAEIKDKKVFCEKLFSAPETQVTIIAYCIMPTHLHLILKGLKERGISNFMRKALNSYAKYFNLKTQRKGPLWESIFNNILVETDEQLLHLTRYIHLNPVTAHLVDRPQDWHFSSYNEFLGKETNQKLCSFSDILVIDPADYRKFVNSRIVYQRELAKLKKVFLE